MNTNWYAMELIARQRIADALLEAATARRHGIARPQTLRSRISGLLVAGGRRLEVAGERLGATVSARPAGEAARVEQPCR